MSAKCKSNKRLIEENEEEITQLKNRIRKLQREAEESIEQADILNREVTTLRQKQRFLFCQYFFLTKMGFVVSVTIRNDDFWQSLILALQHLMIDLCAHLFHLTTNGLDLYNRQTLLQNYTPSVFLNFAQIHIFFNGLGLLFISHFFLNFSSLSLNVKQVDVSSSFYSTHIFKKNSKNFLIIHLTN